MARDPTHWIFEVGPAISELVVTSDGFVLAQAEGEVGANEMLGTEVDLNRNLLDLIAAAGLTAEEIHDQGLQQIEYMRMKLIVGRLAGIAIGLLLWWTVLGPTFGDNPLLVFISLIVVLFGGLYIGQMVVLSMVAGRK